MGESLSCYFFFVWFLFSGVQRHLSWVEGALESAYQTVYKILRAAKLPDKLAELKTKWGNPRLPCEETADIYKLLDDQAFYGALLSTTSDYKNVRDALKAWAAGSDTRLEHGSELDLDLGSWVIVDSEDR